MGHGSFKVENHKKIAIKCETEWRDEKTNGKKKKNKKGDGQITQQDSEGKTDNVMTKPAPVVGNTTNSEGIYSVIKSRSTETLV